MLHRFRRAMVARAGTSSRGLWKWMKRTCPSRIAKSRHPAGRKSSTTKVLMVMAVEIVEPKGFGRIRLRALTGRRLPRNPLCAGGGRARSQTGTHGWFGGIPRSGRTGIHPPAHRHARLRRTCPCLHGGSAPSPRWCSAGCWERITGSVQPDHLDAYLDEFVFRFNRRTSSSRRMLFYRLLQQAVVTPPRRMGMS